MYRQTIYKQDSKGNLRSLEVWTDGAELKMLSGLTTGKKVLNSTTVTAKNVGRSNETTPPEQAILQAKAKIEQKLKKMISNTGDGRTLEEEIQAILNLPSERKI